MNGDDEDDLRRLRDQEREADDERSRAADEPPIGAPRFAAKTIELDAYPTTTAAFYAVQRSEITGVEIEGEIGVETAKGASFLAFNLGDAIPPVGTRVEITYVPHRHVFTHGTPRVT